MEILEGTPTWVYILFVFLLLIGFKSIQPKTVGYRRLFLLPIIFAIWNLYAIFNRLDGKYSIFLLWMIGLFLGAVVGWQMVRTWKVRASHRKKTITLPGSYSTLILILLVFAVRYYIGYREAVDPNLSEEFYLVSASATGVITGIFLGRAIELYRKYLAART